MRTGCHYFTGLTVCTCFRVCVCVTFVVITDLRELYGADLHKLGIYGSGRVWANAWDVFRRTPSRGGRGRRAAVDLFRGVYCVFGGISCFFFFVFVTLSAHGPLQVYEPLLLHFPLLQ